MKITTRVDENSPWFSKYWPETVPTQLTYDDSLTLYDILERNAGENPDYKAVWFLDTWVTYEQLKDMVDRFASGLNSLGAKKGDVLALILPNCIQYVVAYYAAIKLGVIVTGVNPTYKPGEVLHQLKLTGAEYVLILDMLDECMLGPIRNELDFKGVVSTNLVDLAGGMSTTKKVLGKMLGRIPKGKVPDSSEFLKVLENAGPDSPRAVIDQEQDPAAYIMTGGTTGEPKAAVLTHRNVYTNALQVNNWVLNQPTPEFEVPGPKGAVVGVLPLFHSFGMTCVMNSAIMVKAWMMLFPKPPSTSDLLKTFEKLDISNGMIYPGAEILFQRIADFPKIGRYKAGLASLFCCVSGAGPLHRHMQDKFESLTATPIVEGYGLTETGPVVSVGNFIGEERCTGTIGLPIPGTEWKIFPVTDFDAGPVGTLGEEEDIGEICVSGPQVMKGYLNQPEETAAAIREWDHRQWMLTGDLGHMDEFGRIVIRDRKKQLIKMKGYSIYPKEIEELIGMHPDVREVAAAGIPDPETGEFVKAWVKVDPESALTPAMLRDWCKENMTHYKVPKEIEFMDQIPKNIIGKVMRRSLQEMDPRFCRTRGIS
jgi:long-chain acyl-CoA synthetase